MLWPLLAWLSAILLDMPFFYEHRFLVASITVVIIGYIVGKLLKRQIKYQKLLNLVFNLEMVYKNDYTQNKRLTLIRMLAYIAIFIYMLIMFIWMILSESNISLFDYFICGTFTIMPIFFLAYRIRYYIQARKARQIVLPQGKQLFISKMIAGTVLSVYLLIIFIWILSLYSSVSSFDYFIFGALCGIITMILIFKLVSNIKNYILCRKNKQVILPPLQDCYQVYEATRHEQAYEEMFQSQPKYQIAIGILNGFFAVLGIMVGLLATSICIINEDELISDLAQIGYITYGMIVLYLGADELLNILEKQKHLVSLFSFVIVLLLSFLLVMQLYMPLTNLMGRYVLKTYITDNTTLSYETEVNLVQKTILFDNITDFEIKYLKELSILDLSVEDELFGENNKELLEKMLGANAEFQILYKDLRGQRIIIKLTPSELKQIYNVQVK